jgi:hypothetical protein
MDHFSFKQDLDPKEHHLFFRRMGDFDTDVIFHHEHIWISLNKINQVADKIIEEI